MSQAFLMSAHRCGRVDVRGLCADDLVPLLTAVQRSEQHTRPWNHVPDEEDLWGILALVELGIQSVFVAVDRVTGDIAGKVSVYNVLRGSSQTATLGYDAYLPHAGTGRMTEALRLVVDRCFAVEPDGLGLHRLEVNTEPDNTRSLGVARRLGFRAEGFSPRFQRLRGRWCDCARLALTAEEWAPLTCCPGPPA